MSVFIIFTLDSVRMIFLRLLNAAPGYVAEWGGVDVDIIVFPARESPTDDDAWLIQADRLESLEKFRYYTIECTCCSP